MIEELKILKQQNDPIVYIGEKGNEMSIYKGFKYYLKHVGKFDNTMSCFLKDCRGSYKISIKTNKISDERGHHHPAMNSSELKVLLFKEVIKTQCTTSRKTTNEIICSASMLLDDSERQQLPSLENIKRRIRNLQDVSHNFSFSTNYDIPDELCMSRSGSKFVHFDNYFYTKEQRVIGLWSNKNVKEANKRKVFALDGTFYACPSSFYQLLVFFGVENSRHVPFAYFLVPDKCQETYNMVLDILIEQAGIINVPNVIVDFELAMEKAFRAKYKNISMRFCLFHYSQAVYRKLKSLELAKLYKEDKEFRFLIKCLLFLHLLGKMIGNPLLKHLAKEIFLTYKSKNVRDFVNYYYVNWYLSNFFGENDLYERIIFDIPFTNNGAEGFNSALKKEVKGPHPSLIELLIVLRNRDYLNELSSYQKVKISKQKDEYLDRNEKIVKKLREFENGDKLQKLKELTGLYTFNDNIIE